MPHKPAVVWRQPDAMQHTEALRKHCLEDHVDLGNLVVASLVEDADAVVGLDRLDSHLGANVDMAADALDDVETGKRLEKSAVAIEQDLIPSRRLEVVRKKQLESSVSCLSDVDRCQNRSPSEVGQLPCPDPIRGLNKGSLPYKRFLRS